MNLALVGFGYWGPKLGRAIMASSSANLVAVVDSSRMAQANASREFPDVLVTDSMKDALREAHIDGVVIATPPATHSELTIESLHCGLHVLVEKPLATRVQEIRSIDKFARQSGLKVMPGHTFLFNDAFDWVKKFIEAGELGEILCIYSQRLNLGQIRSDVNVLWNLAPHDVSIFDYLIGSRAKSVSATGSDMLQPGIHDIAFLSISYPNSVIAHAHLSWLDPTKTRKVTIVGSKSMVVIDDTSLESPVSIHLKTATVESNDEKSFSSFRYKLRSGEVRTPVISYREPLVSEINHFVEVCLGKSQAQRATVDDALSVAAVLTAASVSMKNSGKSVEVKYND